MDEDAAGEGTLAGSSQLAIDVGSDHAPLDAEDLDRGLSADDSDACAEGGGSVREPQAPEDPGADGGESRNWRSLTAVAVVGLLAVAFVAPVPAMLKYPTWAQDEGTLLVFPSLMLKGAVPNHTFLSIYGSANLYALAAAFFIGGQSVLVERLVAVFYHLVLVCSLTALVWRRRGRFAALVAGAVTVVVGVSYPMMAFAWVGAIAFLCLGLFLLDVGLSDGGRRLVCVTFSGLFLGLAISFRADLSVAVLLGLVVLAAARRRGALYLLPGLVIGLIPTMVSMVQVGVVAVVQDEIIKPVFVIAPQVRLPLPSIGTAAGLLMVLCLVVPVAEIVVGIAGWRRSHGAWNDVCVVLVGVVGLSMISNMLHRADVTHIAFVATFTLGSAVMLDWGRLAEPLAGRRSLRTATKVAWSALLGIVVIAVATAASANVFGEAALETVGARPNVQLLASNAGRSVPVDGQNEFNDYSAVLRAVDSYELPGALLFVGPEDLRRTFYSDTFLYFLLPELVPGSYYLEMDPGVTNATGSGLAGQIAGDDLLILDSAYNSSSVAEPYVSFGSNAPNLVVAKDFRQVGRWGPLSLYVRRGWHGA